jgi:hypothetical protein
LTYTIDTAIAALRAREAGLYDIQVATHWEAIEEAIWDTFGVPIALIPERTKWHACGIEIIAAHDSGESAAKDYVKTADWGESADMIVHVWRMGIDQDGDWVRVDEQRHKFSRENYGPRNHSSR